MPAFRRILCPIDFSDCSKRALERAFAVAQRDGGSITVLHVVSPIAYTDALMAAPVAPTPEELADRRKALDTFVQETLDSTPVERLVMTGNAVSTILDVAESIGADLIVVGTHGRHGFQRVIIGSVTERLLRKTGCPVLTVPPHVVPLVGGRPVFTRILAATDFSAAAMCALDYADSLAAESHAALTVLHVLEPAPVYEPVFEAAGRPFAVETAREAILTELRTLAPRSAQSTKVVAAGEPHCEILAQAAIEQSDLIVIGVHSGLREHFRIGSTTNHIVREATCPVLSVRG